jgi:hypothetical protein
MSEFGKCEQQGCDRDADVGLNGSYVCLAHFEERLRNARKAVERIFGAWTTGVSARDQIEPERSVP